MPSAGSRPAVMFAAWSFSGSAPIVTWPEICQNPPIDSNDLSCPRRSWKLSHDRPVARTSCALLASVIVMTRSKCGSGHGRASTPYTMQKIIALTPMPRPSTATTTAAKPGEQPEPHGLAHDQPLDVCARGPERHADADLARALGHRVGHDAVDTERGDDQRDHREHAHELRVDPRLPHRVLDVLAHRHRVRERQVHVAGAEH